MFPYLKGPQAGAVEQALCNGEFAALRAQLGTSLAGHDDPELRHILGLMEYFHANLEAASDNLERAYHSFRQRNDSRGAAMVAVSLGRFHHDGVGDQPIGRGWLARAITLLEGEDPCVEQGWALLGLVGCSVDDTSQLEVNAKRALQLARQFRDVELECKALADLGLALVSLGRPSEGMPHLDQAMIMLHSRECTNPIVASQVVCDLLSACERVADLPRADMWIHALEEMRYVQPPDRKPSFMFTHCRIAYGIVLCDVGRWTEAEVAFQICLATAETSGRNQQVASRAALADLWIQQGRLDAAAALLEGRDDRIEALPPLARLHLARGNCEAAAAVARQALRVLGGDRMRAAPLLSYLVDAELGRGDIEAAEAAVAKLSELAAGSEPAYVAALECRALGHIARQRGDVPGALSALEAGLTALTAGGWPLMRGALHLEIAELRVPVDRAAAIAEAKAALAIFHRVDAPGAEGAARLLEELGEPVALRPHRSSPLDVLTPRERDVFDLLVLGLPNAAIARKLFITPKTTEHHVSSVLGKLGLRSRAEAAAYASTLNLPYSALQSPNLDSRR